MATHAREAALDALVARLQRIGDEDEVPTGKAWSTSQTLDVVRKRKIGWNDINLPACNVIAGNESKARTASGGTTSMYTANLNVELVCWFRTDDEPDQYWSQILHDVDLILGDDYTLGGTVFDSEVTGDDVELEEAGEPIWRGTIGVTLTYRYYEQDPSTLV